MKIVPTQQSTYKRTTSPTFGWSKVCSGKIINRLQNGTTREIPVDICVLKAEDKPFIQAVYEKWKWGTTYGDKILQRFIYKNPAPSSAKEPLSYFMLIPQKPVTPKGKAKPLCIAEVRRSGDEFELCYLQNSPSIMSKNEAATAERIALDNCVHGLADLARECTTPRVSGTGQMLLYGICRYIKSMGGKKLEIYSRNDGFYEKIFNSKKNFYKRYDISTEKLTQFIEATRAKFDLPKDAPELPKKITDEITTNTFW